MSSDTRTISQYVTRIRHLACGETFLTYGLCSGLQQTTSKQVTSWRAHNKVLPITELILVLLNGCAWLVSQCVTMNVPSNVVGGFGTSCCVISLSCATVCGNCLPKQSNLVFLVAPAMAKHAHVVYHLNHVYVSSVLHRKRVLKVRPPMQA